MPTTTAAETMTRTTDYLLLRGLTAARPDAELCAALAQAFQTAPADATLQRVAWSPEHGQLHAYWRLGQRLEMADDVRVEQLRRLGGRAARLGSMTLSRLELVLDLPGHSRNASAHHHYVVETDADEGWMPEIARWYADEHMPGLAAVPGCIRAMRLINHDDGPASYACYDLSDAQVLGSPPWLAVRGTEWSSRTRPHFVNTRRTMFETVC